MNSKLFNIKQEWPAIIFLIALAVAIYLPMLIRMQTDYDYVMHNELAEKMLQSGSIVTPHFLYQLLTILVGKLLPSGQLATAGIIVLLACYSLSAIIIFGMLRPAGNLKSPAAALAAAGLLLTAPILALAPFDGHLYFGYIGLNVFHNPTITVLKPLALLLFYFSGSVFVQGASNKSGLIVGCALLCILSALAKPSFVICLVPALLVYACILATLQNIKPDWKLLFAGFLAPSIGILAMQYYWAYSSEQLGGLYQGKSSIIMAPFAVMSGYSSWLLPKLLLSILFPCAVLVCYFKSAMEDRRLVFAWIMFAFGMFYTYFLAESGPRMVQGNFTWSGQITLFILFVATALFFIREPLQGNFRKGFLSDRKAISCSIFFLMHLISGFVFYAAEYRQPELYW